MFDTNFLPIDISLLLGSKISKNSSNNNASFLEKSILFEEFKYIFFISKEYVHKPNDELKEKFVEHFENLILISRDSLVERISESYKKLKKITKTQKIAQILPLKKDIKENIKDEYIKINELSKLNQIKALYDIKGDFLAAMNLYIDTYSFLYDRDWVLLEKKQRNQNTPRS